MKFWLGALFLLSPLCQAASFDCASDKLSATEKTICADEYLSGADNVLNRRWDAVYTSSTSRSLLKAQQLDWLKQRTSCGADVDCIKQGYQERIAQLSRLATFSSPSQFIKPEKIDPPMVQGLVSDAGYAIRENHWLIKPLIGSYAISLAVGHKQDEISGYEAVGHAVAGDNLYVYLVVYLEEGPGVLLEVNDLGHARTLRTFPNESTLYADPDGQDVAGAVHFFVYPSGGLPRRVNMDVGANGAVTETMDDVLVSGPLPRYERESWQGFCADSPCRSDSQSPSRKWRVASANFMSTDKDDGVYLFEANRPDSGVNVFSQKANERVDDAFSFTRSFVWGEGDIFYFDNEGGMACVWRTDITAKTTERIIPVESIQRPYFLTYRGREMLVATDTDRNGDIYIATPEVK